MSTGMQACTVIASNYVSFARVLARSYAAHHAGARPAVLVLDDDEGRLTSAAEPFDVVRPRELGTPAEDLEEMFLLYDAKELATALKPWLLQLLLDRGGPALFLDPDVEVHSDLSLLGGLAAERGVVLTPHALEPIPVDGRTPTERHVHRSGIFNGGFLGVGDAARPFLSWWAERLRWDCVVSASEGLFVDQRWLDFVPSYFPHEIVRDRGCNVAYWNLHEREVAEADGRFAVDGGPLRFFHFSGFDPHSPQRLTRVADRITVADRPALARLCSGYAQRLLDEGYAETIRSPYGLGSELPRFRLGDRQRRLLRESVLASPGGDAVSLDAVMSDEAESRLSPLRRASFLVEEGAAPERRRARGRALRLVRRLVQRSTEPEAALQREVNLALLAALREQEERDAARVAALEARLDRLERAPGAD